MIEFIMVISIFLMITLGAMQWIAIANARSYLNVAAYTMCREYAISQSKAKSTLKAAQFLAPLALQSAYGIPKPSWKIDDDDITVKITLYYKLFPIPLVRTLFSHSQNWIEKKTGFFPIQSSCVIKKEET